MSRQGTVVAVDREQAVAAIAVDNHGYTLIELTSEWEIAVGDTIAWEHDEALGFVTYENRTRATSDEVFVQNHYVSEQEMRMQLTV